MDDPEGIFDGSQAVACRDCGLLYGSARWCDVVIPDSLWELITKDDGATILCFNCMAGRLDKLHLRNVPYQVTSGPFAFWVRDITNESREAWEAVVRATGQTSAARDPHHHHHRSDEG